MNKQDKLQEQFNDSKRAFITIMTGLAIVSTGDLFNSYVENGIANDLQVKYVKNVTSKEKKNESKPVEKVKQESKESSSTSISVETPSDDKSVSADSVGVVSGSGNSVGEPSFGTEQLEPSTTPVGIPEPATPAVNANENVAKPNGVKYTTDPYAVPGIMASLTGVPAETWYNIIMRESRFDPTAQNPTSTAHGLFQSLYITSNNIDDQIDNALYLFNNGGLQHWALTNY